MPETPWPSGHKFRLAERSDGGGAWIYASGGKLGKFYHLDNTKLGDYKASAYINTTNGSTMDNGFTKLQVLGVMSSDSIPVLFDFHDDYHWVEGDDNNIIWNDSLWGVIANTYPDGDQFDKPMIRHYLYHNGPRNPTNAVTVNYDDLRKAASGNREYNYKYRTKSGNIYDKPSDRNMCPGTPQWGFKANTHNYLSEIRCRYDLTDRGQMNALAASLKKYGPDDQTNTSEQIKPILEKFCLRGDNYEIDDLGGLGDTISCKEIVGDVGLLSNFCRYTSGAGADGIYNAVKYSDLCSYENLQSNSDGNYRNVWKSVCKGVNANKKMCETTTPNINWGKRMCEENSLYNVPACDLFWATESTLAARPGDNPGIEDPCSPELPEANRPPACNNTQGVVDRIDEAFASGNVNVSGGISSGAERRLCYDGSGRGANAVYDWKKVTKEPDLCTTQIQICNNPLSVSGAVASNFNQTVICTQNSGGGGGGGGGGGDPEIIEGSDPTETARSPSDQPAPAPTPEPEEKSFVQRWWWVLLLVVVLVMMMVMGIVVVV